MVYFENVGAELNTNGDLVLNFEFVVHDSAHQATFPDSSVSDDDEFEQVVLFVEGFVLDDLERNAPDFLLLTVLHFLHFENSYYYLL